MGMRKLADINESMINEVSEKKHSMINEPMNREKPRRKLCNAEEAEAGALRYEKELNAPECHKFFLKVMYHLPYDTRETILEYSRRSHITSPKKYFTHAAKRELRRRGY